MPSDIYNETVLTIHLRKPATKVEQARQIIAVEEAIPALLAIPAFEGARVEQRDIARNPNKGRKAGSGRGRGNGHSNAADDDADDQVPATAHDGSDPATAATAQ